jgi:hypothetical protein
MRAGRWCPTNTVGSMLKQQYIAQHRPRGGGDRNGVSGAAVGGVVFLSAAVATTAPSSLLSRTPPLETRCASGCFRHQERVQTRWCVIDGAVPDQESPSILPWRRNVGPYRGHARRIMPLRRPRAVAALPPLPPLHCCHAAAAVAAVVAFVFIVIVVAVIFAVAVAVAVAFFS